jgi:topoisomerase-4 subunit A
LAQLESLMRANFLEYASYSILDRAIPELRDGLKPVQRRILHTLFEINDGRFHKVAGVIGDTMKLHPHGDASIGDALVVLANKGYFIERQGNFGNILTGHPAAAGRYIECRLTELALETMFNAALTEYSDSYDGRAQEPVFLPSKLPVALMLGTEGIAVGMATRILPHNLVELWEAQLELLEGERALLEPDFPQGGLMDISEYHDGQGKVEVRARIEARGERTVVIREVPYGTTTESLIASIEAAAQKGRVKVASISDYTTDKVEIELTLQRGEKARDVIPQLFAYTDCCVTLSSNIVVIEDRKPVELTVSQVLETATHRLRDQIRAELEWEQGQLSDRKHWLTLEQIFVEKRVYKRIEEASTDVAVRREVVTGMQVHETLFVRPMLDEDVKRLLDLRIRRISAYDIERNRKEIGDLDEKLADVALRLQHLTRTTMDYVKGLIDRFGAEFPRRTRVERFDQIDKKAVAHQSITLQYDKDTGFFGSSVKGVGFSLPVSEFDLVLAISDDGTYRIMPPPDKTLLPGKVLHCKVFDPEKGFEATVVYRDRARHAYGKRIHIQKFVRNREYQLIKDKQGKVDLLLDPAAAGTLTLSFVPAPRQRSKSAKFDLQKLEKIGVAAKGVRLAPKPVRSIKHAVAKAKKSGGRRPPRSSGPAGGRQQSLL